MSVPPEPPEGGTLAHRFMEREKKGAALPAVPLPLHARAFLEKLPALPNVEAAVAALQPLLRHSAAVSRLRRAALIAGCLAFPMLALVGVVFGTRMMKRWQNRQPEIMELSQLLSIRSGLRMAAHMPGVGTNAGPDDRLFAVYIAHHYRQAITNESKWSSLHAITMITGEKRRFAEQSLVEHPGATDKEIAEADQAMQPLLKNARTFDFSQRSWFPFLAGGLSLIIYVGIPALIAALLFRGGLVLRLCGVAVVRRDGRRASRLRVFWRGLVAWSPVLAVPVVAGALTPVLGIVWAASLLAALAAGLAICSAALPERSLQDRLAGTWLVPR